MKHNLTWVEAKLSRPNCYRMQSAGINGQWSNRPEYIAGYRDQVDQWMADHNCGKWLHKYLVEFKNSKEATMFLLKWK